MFKSSTCELTRFLLSHKKRENRDISLVKIPNKEKNEVGGSYYIKKNEYKHFLKLYSAEFERSRYTLSYAEKFNEISPIVIDIDLKFKGELKSTKITNIHISKLINLHFNYMKHHFDMLVNDKKLISIIFRRPSNPYYIPEKNVSKDGIHIQFPYIKIDKAYKILMREALKERVFEIFDDIENIGTIESTYDDGIAKNAVYWCMYGSGKANKEPYKIDMVIREKNNKLKKITNKFLAKFSTQYKLIKLLSVHLECVPTPFKSIQIGEQLKDHYNMIYGKKMKELIEYREKMFNYDCGEIKGLEQYEVNEIKDLLNCLKPERSTDYNNWITTGLALHSINMNLLPLWKEFSKMCIDKYDPDECEKLWSGFQDNPQRSLMKGSLRLWAKEDNYELYNQLRIHHIFDMLYSLSSSINHNDTARILYKMFGHKIGCYIEEKKSVWYNFRDGRWYRESAKKHLYKYISEQLAKECTKVLSFVCENNYDNKNDQRDKIISNIRNLLHNLKTTSFKNCVVSDCESVFMVDDHFITKLDANRYLLAYSNGVYDFKTHQFRTGLPSDYITLQVPIKFDLNAKNEELEDFLNKILPIPELKKYVLTLLSICLTGKFLQQFTIFIGVGSNGKSKLLELFEHTLGSDFCTQVHHSLITRPRTSSSGPSPEVAKLRAKRVAVMEEPDTRDKINVGQLKWLLSGTKIPARFLNENEIEFYPHYKIFFLVNNNPDIESLDHGTWRRVRCVPFPSRFEDKDKLDYTKQFQYIKDDTIDQKFDDWAPAFNNILLDHYKEYQRCGNKLDVPEIIQRETDKYKSECDFIYAFQRTNVVITNKPDDFVTFTKLCQRFEIWYRNNRGNKPPEPRELKMLFEKNMFNKEIEVVNIFEEGWTGCILRKITQENNEDSDDN